MTESDDDAGDVGGARDPPRELGAARSVPQLELRVERREGAVRVQGGLLERQREIEEKLAVAGAA